MSLKAFARVPLIDLAPYFGGDAVARARVGRELARACEEVGFLYLANHGVDREIGRAHV